ncbi:proteasome subunit beta type-4-like [Schistocerca nitens]|uniref:proteasome subunit beta type-4 n=1 Tax=Schistocerca cancellata TaxID=274614 RepID=UPI002117C9B8|nr:proteasome subunit beta type-4 [Schistocerca cancellata]XP_049805864.1 proteasome subunit beta type-4-like [Schistocerca nitens]XP_049846656.1 proteasome subunit beta type-4-like [Schistocerca gregaria]
MTSYGMGPRTVSKTPITTGTSVIGVKFDSGVVIAADMLGSYGSLARFRNISRIMKVNKNIILGAGGDYADYQYLCDVIAQKIIDEDCLDDGNHLKPKSLHCWLTRVLYNRRSKFDPLWTSFIVGGLQDGEPFLGAVDKLGTAYVDRHIATGFGMHIALPMLRDALEKKETLTKDEAVQLIKKCMEVLFYRDARSFPKYEIGVITADGVEVIGPVDVKGNWEVAHMIRGYE